MTISIIIYSYIFVVLHLTSYMHYCISIYDMPEKEGKLHDIKETASDAATIMRELATPGVHESFQVIRDVAVIAKDIMETMKSPEWQQNMENIRIIRSEERRVGKECRSRWSQHH